LSGLRDVSVLAVHACALLACIWVVLYGYHWIRARSVVLGGIVAIALAGRIAVGLALFAISYYHLPVARDLQVDGGFWEFAIDATGYFLAAAAAVESGQLLPLDHTVPSPFYVDLLALWMMLVGISPAAGLFLNLLLYLAIITLLVACFAPVNDWRRDLPCIVSVSAYSFSPVILLHSTQPLKDEASNLSVALACAGMLALCRLVHRAPGTRLMGALILGTAAVSIAAFMAAGIRWYLAFIMWSTIGLTLMVFGIFGRSTRLRLYLAGSTTVLLAAWVGFWGGSGPFFWNVAPDFSNLTELPSRLLNTTQVARRGFLLSGGNTNIVLPLRTDARASREHSRKVGEAHHTATLRAQANRAGELAAVSEAAAPRSAIAGDALVGSPLGPADHLPLPDPSAFEPNQTLIRADRATPVTVRDHFTVAATGLAIMFIPLVLLGVVSGLEVEGGRGLLVLADLDTVFLDVTLALVLALVWRQRRTLGNRLPIVMFALIFAGTTAILLGYVVTNFGTLWRMRSLVAIPLWMMVVALSPRNEADSVSLPRPNGSGRHSADDEGSTSAHEPCDG
jgi:hypothetical protein